MKTIKSTIYIIALVAIALPQMLYAQVTKNDTINRELTLERDFIPTRNEVQKAFFSPLAGVKKSPLKPLEFANDSYNIGMRIGSRTFAPLYNSYAPAEVRQRLFARLYGGWPGNFGLNTGFTFNPSEKGRFDIALNHATTLARSREEARTIVKQIKMHDTDLSAKYTHNTGSGLLIFGLNGYYDKASIYGTDNNLKLTSEAAEKFGTTPDFPMLGIAGGTFSVEKTAAPISLGSPWVLKGRIDASLTNKQDMLMTGSFPSTYSPIEFKTTEELGLRADATLSYDLSEAWSIGAKGVFHNNTYRQNFGTDSFKNPLHLAVTPYLSYKNDRFEAQAGVALHLVNIGDDKTALHPDLYARYRVSDITSLFLNIDGGTRLFGLRELYNINRYFLAPSISEVLEQTTIKATAGVEVGNLNGFSINIRGGYARYGAFADWKSSDLKVGSGDNYPLTINGYELRKRKDVADIFVGMTMKYITPFGLALNGELDLHNYGVRSSGVKEAVEGLPAFTLKMMGSYRFTEKLSLRVSFVGMADIAYAVPNKAGEYKSISPITELNADLSYRLSKNIGVALIGTNLIGSANQRWLHYEQPRTGVLGAVTLTF